MDQVEQVEPTRSVGRRWRVLCLAALLVIAACGGGDDDGAEDDGRGDRTTTTAADEDTGAAGESTTTTAAGGSATTAPPAPGGPGGVGTQLGVDRAFTGEGSEAFCGEVRAVQTSVISGDAAALDEAAVTTQLAALTPPAEIAADWTLMVTVQQQLSTSQDPDPLASIDQAQLDAYGLASAVVAAYLGDVCQLELLG